MQTASIEQKGKNVSADEYLFRVIQNHSVHAPSVKASLVPIVNKLTQWAGSYCVSVEFSGSIEKGTAIHLSSDADIFISLSSSLPSGYGLADIYNDLCRAFPVNQFNTRRQNVSLGINFSGYSIDIVPGKRISQWGNDHSLYVNSTGTWTKTNVYNHIQLISNSGRANEIKLMKIWKSRHGLKFPSFYLELLVIEALYGKHRLNLEGNFQTALEYIADNIATRRIVDPNNSANIISDDISVSQKREIAKQAMAAVASETWAKVVW